MVFGTGTVDWGVGGRTKRLVVTSYVFMVVVFALAQKRLENTVMGYDFIKVFRPATITFLSGGNPYSVHGFYNPPWMLVFVVPFLIPYGYALFASANLFAFLYTGYRFRMRWMLIPFALFAFVNSFYGNIDGIISLGIFMPFPLNVIWVMAKPQIGIPLTAYLVLLQFKDGRWKEMFDIGLVIIVILVTSVFYYGLWFLKAGEAVSAVWNSSVWPGGIIFGGIFLGLAVYFDDVRWAFASIPFLSPYVAMQTWAFLPLGLLSVNYKRLIK